MDCLFCQIAAKEIPADIIYEDDHVVAFKDINPQAPHHILVIPRQHIPTINDIQTDDSTLVGHCFQVAKQIAADLGVADNGYRLVFNVNKDAGQVVFHIHLHLLAGRKLTWPPG